MRQRNKRVHNRGLINNQPSVMNVQRLTSNVAGRTITVRPEDLLGSVGGGRDNSLNSPNSIFAPTHASAYREASTRLAKKISPAVY